MLRLIQKPVSFLGLAFVVLALPIWWRFRPTPAVALASAAVEVSSNEKALILLRTGLDAKTLAAAGVNANSIAACTQALNTHLVSHPTALSAADTAVANARKESDRLLRLIQAGKATDQEASQYQTQATALATATAQRDAALQAIFEATTASLTQQQRATLSTIRGNSANAEVPVEFRTVARSKAEWLQLRDDLTAERTLAQHGEEAFAPGATRLATARANATVAAARTAINTNLAAVTTAMNAAVSGD